VTRRHRDPERGLVFNVQRYSVHDGAGIRTVVFLKGCPLRCRWCSNPEGRAAVRQLAYEAQRCLGTAACRLPCAAACAAGAIGLASDGAARVDHARCTVCGDCIAHCPSRALEIVGEHRTVDEVLHLVEADGPFYARSGGGLTLSGGEPLLQAPFAARLLAAASARGIDTAMETSGYAAWNDLASVCRHANQVFYDVKCIDRDTHRAGTGVDNARILENLSRLCAAFPRLPIVVRTPVVPGFNDSPREIAAIAAFVHALPRRLEHELLPYHGFGAPKYTRLGWRYALPDVQAPSPQTMAELRRVAAAA
jgi:pyruvate formate lyase activating enzyme